ncbi:MAG: HIT domain-containing protein [Halothiobacillaceae bacterium]|jgi:diadenosine tetraphosphate (Ap4A) HIT family hydrolase|nr:HIT domain-containing protein [Halothiobacillaceae bacterium]
MNTPDDMPGYTLHPQLAADSLPVGHFPLCELRRINESRYPWYLLIPRLGGLSELHDLDEPQLGQLMRESRALAQALHTLHTPDKLNIAVLGNIVPQLHVHHIARHRSDASWPHPVWGRFPTIPLDPDAAQAQIHAMQATLACNGLTPTQGTS